MGRQREGPERKRKEQVKDRHPEKKFGSQIQRTEEKCLVLLWLLLPALGWNDSCPDPHLRYRHFARGPDSSQLPRNRDLRKERTI